MDSLINFYIIIHIFFISKDRLGMIYAARWKRKIERNTLT